MAETQLPIFHMSLPLENSCTDIQLAWDINRLITSNCPMVRYGLCERSDIRLTSKRVVAKRERVVCCQERRVPVKPITELGAPITNCRSVKPGISLSMTPEYETNAPFAKKVQSLRSWRHESDKQQQHRKGAQHLDFCAVPVHLRSREVSLAPMRKIDARNRRRI